MSAIPQRNYDSAMIKFLDLHAQYQSIKSEIDVAIADVISKSAFIGGEYVNQFEIDFGSYVQADFCVGVGNGTDAIEISLEALQLPADSEVIVPANSFIASSEAVTRAGYRVVFADVDPEYYTLDIADVARKLTPSTKAIIAVHLYGHPCEMNALMHLADKHGLRVIEDCAQAHGAKYHGRHVGTFGDIGTYSFYPGKNLGCFGDGGAIVTNIDTLANRCRMIANHGRITKYEHEFEGRNSRLDGLQAAILLIKLKHLDKWINARNEAAEHYNVLLAKRDGIILPRVANNCRHAYHLYVIRTLHRDKLADYLKNYDVQTGVHYPIALPCQPAYMNNCSPNNTPFSVETSGRLLSLPIGEHISLEQIERVAELIHKFSP